MSTCIDPVREPLFLDVSPDHIESFVLQPGPPICLHFRVVDITIIAPQISSDLITTAHRAVSETLQCFAQQRTLRLQLPDEDRDHKLLAPVISFFEAVHCGVVQPDPRQKDLKSLYRGKGGRIVKIGEELWPRLSASLPSTEPPLNESLQPPPDLHAAALSDNEPSPPRYQALTSPLPPPPLSPRFASSSKKRLRPTTPSLPSSSSSSPDYRTWKHIDLVCGEREKMMCELLRRAAKQEKTLQVLLDKMETKDARADDKIARLEALIDKAEGEEAALSDAVSMRQAQAGLVQEPVTTPVPTTAAAATSSSSDSVTESASPVSPGSVSADIPDRLQAYVAAQIDRLRGELACEYAATNYVEQCVTDEVDRVLDRYVEEHQMYEAIREAIDEALEEVRSRVLDAWAESIIRPQRA